jgi:hypothetical protein
VVETFLSPKFSGVAVLSFLKGFVRMRLVLTGFIWCSPLLLNSWEHVFYSIETVKSIPFFSGE